MDLVPPQKSVAFSASFRCEVRCSRQQPGPKETAPSGRRDGNPARNLVAPSCCRRPRRCTAFVFSIAAALQHQVCEESIGHQPDGCLDEQGKKKAREQNLFHCQGHLPLPAAEKRTMEYPSGDMRKRFPSSGWAAASCRAEQQSDSRTVNLAGVADMNRRRGPGGNADPGSRPKAARHCFPIRTRDISLLSPAHCELPFATPG